MSKFMYLLLLFLPIYLWASADQQAQSLLGHADRSFFIENKGQWPEKVLFLAKIGGMNAWITKNGVVYDFYKLEKKQTTIQAKKPVDKLDIPEMRRYGHVVNVLLGDSKAQPTIEPRDQQQAYYNYFIGNDPSRWAAHVPLYKEVAIKDIYDGIDLRYYFDNGLLRYDYIVHPGANPQQIQIKLQGIEEYQVNAAGELILKTHVGEITQGKLLTYQEDKARPLPARFIKRQDGSLGLEIKDYDEQKPLIIDPLVYSTFIGGSDYDYGRSIVLDNDHNTYITGYTKSSDFPTTPGAYNESYNVDYDVFVTKLAANGANLIYSTFLGGSTGDIALSIALDNDHNAYITGYTKSSDFPTTPGAYDEIYNVDYDVFVTKLAADGANLIYSTFLGGSGSEEAYSIALDNDNNAYITGPTSSSNFPTTSGAYNESYNGSSDVFVSKLAANGANLIYSTFLGGSGHDYGRSIALDNDNNAYITGRTSSSDFPTTSGAYDESQNGYDDVFVTKLAADGANLIYSTFIGGSSSEEGYSLALDNDNNAYVNGWTGSSDFPTTSGAYDESYNGSNDVFVTKLAADGANLIYSTFLGGSDYEYGNSIALDNENHSYITGYTGSSDFPTTSGAYDGSHNGSSDVFVTELAANGSNLIYSTFIGGWNYDNGYSIALDNENNAYITGHTYSPNFPTTSGAYDESFNGGDRDGFVTKIFISLPTLQLISPIGHETWQGNTNHNIFWTEGENQPANVVIYFSMDGGQYWNKLTTVQAGKGSFTWNVPPMDNSNCKIRVSYDGLPEYSSQSKNNFTITTSEANAVFVTEPNGGEVIPVGSNQTIQWTTTGTVDSIDIELTTDNGHSWQTIATQIPTADGGYTWIVGMPEPPSQKCRIRLKSSADSLVNDISDDVFCIKGIVVLNPVAGDFLKEQTTQTIRWKSTCVENVKIEYSINYGASWSTITSQYPAADSTYDWTVPSVNSDSCLIRISDAASANIYGLSGLFTIWKPITQTITPSGNGQQTIVFDQTKNTFEMFILNAADITTTYYKGEAPASGDLPTDIVSVKDQYWAITSDVSFFNGYILAPLSEIRDVSDPSLLVWLKRENSGDPWENIGGQVVNDSLKSTVTFSTFNSGHAEFAIGLKENPSAIVETRTIPKEFTLKQNYPNPFNPVTTIEYALPEASEVQLIIYNLLGQKVVELVNSKQTAGYYKYSFDAMLYSSGIYFYVLMAKGLQSNKTVKMVKKMVVLK